MLRKGLAFGVASLATVVLLGAVYADGTVKSGPQVGQEVPGPFHPLNINGKAAGKKNCLYCANAGNPVAVVFAREMTPEVAKLIKQLDAATVKNSGKSMGSYAVFMSDSEGLTKQLEGLADKAKLEKLVLSVDNPAGPKAYNISKDAAVTVLLYNEFVVRANHAYKTGELNEAAIKTIVNDVSKIVASK
jgi:hypothetical protein